MSLPGAVVTITLKATAQNRLHWNCTACEFPGEHAGAAFSLLLEEKTAIGLATPPPERIPVESLSEQELVKQALAEREERAQKERFRLRSSDPKKPWTDYSLTSAASGKTYRVALRGKERGVSYCSCPDFRTNTLGTCKHILYALRRTAVKFPAAALQRPYQRKNLSVHLDVLKQLPERTTEIVRLDGSVPQKKRQQLVNRFQDESECKLFLSTNAGSTGLNLQAADTVINVDLPWNPAVLEQRLGECVTEDDTGRQRLSITLPDRRALDDLAGTLARLVATTPTEDS